MPVSRFGSLVEWDDPTELPLGVATIVKNSRYNAQSVGTRYGTKKTFVTGANTSIGGLGFLKYLASAGDVKLPIVYDTNKGLWYESPQGSGTKVAVADPFSLLAAGYQAQIEAAYNKAWIAQSDLIEGRVKPCVFDGNSKNLDPVSEKPVGIPWSAATKFRAGHVISPTVANGHLYRTDGAGGGVSGNVEPVWPVGAGATVADNGMTWTEITPSMAVSATAGNICTGLRWMIVLFVNRNGYISGWTSAVPVTLNIGTAARSIDVANIPLGPANTAKRICAFTVALAAGMNGAAGPFKYIPQIDTFSSVSQTSTVIADNVTTAATFNFLDDYLVGAPDVTNYFRKIEVPECSDIYYSRILDAMIYSGLKGYPGGIMISNSSDPETVNLPGSLLQVGQNDGQRVVCAREDEQTIYIFKEESGHILQPNSAGAPQTWGISESWHGSGPCGPRAVDIRTGIMAYAHFNGLYVRVGSGAVAEIVTKELKATWPTINWAAKQVVWVKIDEAAQEILVGVPIGAGQTVPNKIIRLNYKFGWEDPVVFSVRMGKLIPNVNGRKWSVDDIAANVCLIAPRDLTVLVDARIDHRQILFGSSAADGLVRMQVPDYYSDENNAGAKLGIDWQYQTVHTPSDGIAVMQLGGISLSMKCSGQINVSAIRDDAAVVPFTFNRRILSGSTAKETNFDAAARDQKERWMIKFDNGAVADNWAELHKANLHMRGMWGSRKG